jgi:hypothetical protein
MDWVRQDLTDHVGGQPNAVQWMLIERCAVLSLRLAMIDEKIINDVPLTLCDNNHIIAWQNSLTKALKTLGVHRSTPDVTLANYVTEKHGGGAT